MEKIQKNLLKNQPYQNVLNDYRKERKSLQRINWDDTEDIDMITHFNKKPFTGICFYKHKNGNLKTETQLKNGLRHGIEEWFSENGKLSMINIYMDDNLWLLKSYYPDGKSVYKVMTFKNKTPEKELTCDKNGNMKELRSRKLKNGKFEGFLIMSDTPNIKHIFRDGVLIDIIQLDTDGNDMIGDYSHIEGGRKGLNLLLKKNKSDNIEKERFFTHEVDLN